MYQQRVTIVGAGIVGLATAFALLKQGMKDVTVLEQAVVDHQQAASHGISRLLRFEYGADMLYTRMVRLALRRWRELEKSTGRTLYTPTGLLVLGTEDDQYTTTSYSTLRELGLLPEHLTRHSCTQRFPQFNNKAYTAFTYNTEAGMLHASTCLRTLKKSILDLGGKILEHHRVIHFNNDHPHRPIRLSFQTGAEMLTDRVIIAAGPWVHRLLGDYQLPVRLTRQYLLYFTGLSKEEFGLNTFPAFIADDLYGFPIHSSTLHTGQPWLKIASHVFGSTAEPDEIRAIDERVIKHVHQSASILLPALQQATLANVESYIYDVSPDEDFILDHLPDDHRVVFATGLTGHGFKFGLLLGEILSSLTCETEPIVPLDRFRLSRFPYQQRAPVHSVA